MSTLRHLLAGRDKLSASLFWAFVGYYVLAAVVFAILVFRAIPAHGAELSPPLIRCQPINPNEIALTPDGYRIKAWNETIPFELTARSLDEHIVLCAMRGDAVTPWIPLKLYVPGSDL